MRTRYISNTLHLESSTSLYTVSQGLESLFLLAITNSPFFFLGPGAVSLVTGALASTVGYGLLAAGSIALSLSLQKPPTSPKPSDIQSNIRQPLSPRRRIYNRFLTGSVIVFAFRRGEKSYLLHYICEGPIEGYVSYRLDRKPVTLDVDGFVTQDQYQVGGRSRVQILTTLGLETDEPFQEILDAFPELDDPLKPFRHRGCAMVLQIVEQVDEAQTAKTYPNNMPSLQVVVDGQNDIYDPRTSTTGLTGNAGLCLLAEIMNVYGLGTADTDALDFASFSSFATHCDTPIDLKAGGTEPRYLAAGMIMMNAENEERIKAIAAVCNADVFIDPQGRISVREKLRTTPGIALRADYGDHLSDDIAGGRSLQKSFNTIKVTYLDPTLNYKENEVAWRHPDLLEDDGEELSETLSVTLCPSATQAQRLGKLFLYEQNPEYAGQLTSGPQALDLLENYSFTLDLSTEDDFERVACANGDISYDAEKMTVSASLIVLAAGATDWDPEIDEQQQVDIPPILLPNVDDVLLDVTAVFAIIGGAPVLKFSWVPHPPALLPDSYSQEVEVSPADAGDWNPATENQDNDTAQYPVIDGIAYDWRIRNRSGGKAFDWQNSTVPVGVFRVFPRLDFSLNTNLIQAG